MTPQKFAKRLQSLPSRLEREIIRAERKTVKEAKTAAVRLSSGATTARQLQRLGHPYARRDPRAVNPQIINVRMGAFRSAWKAKAPRRARGGIVSSVYNDSFEARFMQRGTKSMISRPIRAAVMRAVSARRRRRLQGAIKRALKV